MTIADISLLPYPFDKYQIRAIEDDSKIILVNAGAGSGKTSTIIGKVLYLLLIKNIDPEKILVLAFNNSIAAEIRNKLNSMVNLTQNNEWKRILSRVAKNDRNKRIYTFHSFSRYLSLKKTKKANFVPKIAFKNDKELTFIFGELFKNERLRLLIQNFFMDRIQPKSIFHDINDMQEYNKYVKPTGVTLSGERVKSIEELTIANFLLLKGIKFKYEDRYDVGENYLLKPDFHLFKEVDGKAIYDIYFEHFALDKNGKPPHFFSVEDKEKYIENYRFKKQKFAEDGVDYFFTYSYQFSDGSIFENISRELKLRNIEADELDVGEALRLFRNYKKASPFIENIKTAMDNFKINELSIEGLYESNKKSELGYGSDSSLVLSLLQKVISSFFSVIFYSNENNLGRFRTTQAFIEIFEAFFSIYQDTLSHEGIDFDDQILIAKNNLTLINQNTIDYLIVDEFQDISKPRAEIIRNIQKRNENVNLFLVGDDWQSINGFSGSDYKIMTKYLARYFGEFKKIDLAYTYRFNDKVCSITKKFIEKNDDLIKKNLVSHKGEFPKSLQDREWNKQCPYYIRYIPGLGSTKDLPNSIKKQLELNQERVILKDLESLILKLKNKNKSIMFLTRLTRLKIKRQKLIQRIVQKLIQQIKCEGSTIPKDGDTLEFRGGLFEKTSFRTVHKSKGLEADIVVILNCFENQGFPFKRKQDEVLTPFFSHLTVPGFGNEFQSLEKMREEEERRLFYVALTRAKDRTIIYSDNKDNPFLEEIKNLNEAGIDYKIENIDLLDPSNEKILTSENAEIRIKLKNIKRHSKGAHKNAYAQWSKDEEEKLKSLHYSGNTTEEIAAALGRQNGGVRSRLKKLGYD